MPRSIILVRALIFVILVLIGAAVVRGITEAFLLGIHGGAANSTASR
jgi:hypothetical protein